MPNQERSVIFTEDQQGALKLMANASGKSQSEIIRLGVMNLYELVHAGIMAGGLDWGDRRELVYEFEGIALDFEKHYSGSNGGC